MKLKVTLQGEHSPPLMLARDQENGWDAPTVKEGEFVTVEFDEKLTIIGNPFMPMRPIVRIELVKP